MRRALLLACSLALAASAWAQPGYDERPEVRAFIRDLVARHGFAESELAALFSRVQRAEPVLEAIRLPAEKRSWEEYRAIFFNDRRIEGGVEFWQAHRDALERAEREYGVPPQYIVAIIGVETIYGRNTGRWRVLDALTTLAFDYPPRAGFFRGELESYLLLARDAGLEALSVRGSYAGAIGIPQFMPSSLRRYAVDFDGDGAIDLERNAVDAIGSVGSFLKQHGWQAGGQVFVERGEPGAARGTLVDLGSEQRIGLRNFHVLTRYNRSALYASAVADLAQALDARVAQSAGR